MSGGEPSLGALDSSYWVTRTKEAVTVRSWDMSTTHWSVPAQAPLHPENVDPPFGVAISRTVALLGYPIPHVPDSAPPVIVHKICGDASGEVTVPEPAPLACTRSTC